MRPNNNDTYTTTRGKKTIPTFYLLYSVEHILPTYSKSHFFPMPSTFFLRNLFMERKKQRASSNSTADELALVKAAAWAWYQHGSGSEGKQMREFDVTRTRQAPTPSRYKLEAMKKIPKTSIHNTTDHNSLLDAYEIASISRKLDGLVESNDDKFCSSSRFLAGDRQENAVLFNDNNVSTKKKKKKMIKGFWLRNAAGCGAREDVVAARGVHKGRPDVTASP